MSSRVRHRANEGPPIAAPLGPSRIPRVAVGDPSSRPTYRAPRNDGLLPTRALNIAGLGVPVLRHPLYAPGATTPGLPRREPPRAARLRPSRFRAQSRLAGAKPELIAPATRYAAFSRYSMGSERIPPAQANFALTSLAWSHIIPFTMKHAIPQLAMSLALRWLILPWRWPGLRGG